MWNENDILLVDATEAVKQVFHKHNSPLISDKVYEIKLCNATIGQVHVSDGAMENFALIDWIEVFDSYHGMHLLKPILERLGCKLVKEKFYLDANIDLVPKYLSIGAHITANGYDECREMVEMVYELGCKRTEKKKRKTFQIVYRDALQDEDNILYGEFRGSKENADEYAKICTKLVYENGYGFEDPCRAILKTTEGQH